MPKPDGRQGLFGIATLEDKIVRRLWLRLLTAIYEEDRLGFFYGFRPGRGAHGALGALDALVAGITERKTSGYSR